MIKDSGERRQFFDADGNPLAVRDMAEGKGRFDLMPWAALMEVAKHCEMVDTPWKESEDNAESDNSRDTLHG
jgi:hypothetical protein